MSKIYIVALEPIDSRYTKQWFDAIPEEILLEDPNANVITVSGSSIGESKTEGAFLDFALTNIWKNTQINKIAKMFSDGEIQPGDKFLVTDAWHPGIIQIRYMSELLHIPVEIHAIWHAGSYDKTDILGFTIKDKQWSHGFERAVYHACDYNWFGSKHHMNLFCSVLNVPGLKAFHSGQPHKQIIDSCASVPFSEKENIVVFGHRISPDKQPEIFDDLAKEFPDYKFVFTQKMNLSKPEYYNLLRKAKLSFSANLHENFGISMVESIFNGTWVLLPDRLSYSEMYSDEMKYPSDWTSSWDNYIKNKSLMVGKIKNILHALPRDGYLELQKKFLLENYMSSKVMVRQLIK